MLIKCPHCQCLVQIESVNCNVFRHGSYKEDGNQIPAHLPKDECDRLSREDLIYGCGKPFRIKFESISSDQNTDYDCEICDYI